MKTGRRWWLTLSFSLLGGLVLMLILAPLVGMVLATPAESLAATAAEQEVRDSIVLTLWTSMVATLVFAIGAVPLAYLLARKHFFGKRLLTAIIDLPLMIPHSAAGIALLTVISRDSLAGRLADGVGLKLAGAPAGIVLGMAFVSIPFLVTTARSGFEAVPERLEKAALTLGASPMRVFFTVSLPLAWRSVVSGMVSMFARGMSEFGAVIIIAYHPIITPILIYERFGAFGLKYALPVAVLFITICLVVFILLRLLAGEKEQVR